MITILGSNTRPLPASLKHFFKALERPGTTAITDSAGGCVVDFAAYGGTGNLLFDTNGSYGTVQPIGMPSGATNNIPTPLASGAWHTFAGTKPIVGLYSARYAIDPLLVFGAAPLASGNADARCSLGDINNIGLPSGTKYATPAGVGMAGSVFHAAIGTDASNQWKVTSFFRDIAPGATVEPDLVNYPPDMVGSSTLAWLSTIGFKFAYDEFYPYRTSPPAALVERDITVVMIYDPVGGTKSYKVFDTDTLTPIIETNTTTTDTLSSSFTPNPCLRISNLALYGYALFEFDAMPAGMETYAKWMGQRWKNKEMVIHPHLYRY